MPTKRGRIISEQTIKKYYYYDHKEKKTEGVSGKSFFFYTGIGEYTGTYAASLNDFVRKLDDVPIRSIEFHLKRGDFSKWIRDVFHNEILSDWLDRIPSSAKGEDLRRKIQSKIKEYLQHHRFHTEDEEHHKKKLREPHIKD